jgi:myo-inositol-1(or 4)-monophosphatase
MDAFLNTAVKAARKAGDLITRAIVQDVRLQISEKSERDFVTQIDRSAEACIIETLLNAYPDHAVLAEESGRTGDLDAEFTWIVDPLDGTHNFIRGLPQFTVSIALMHQHRLSHAVIYHPLTQDLFTAIRGQGAQLNDRRLRVSGDSRLEGILFSAGIPSQPQHSHHIIPVIQWMQASHCVLRRSGSTALDLAYVGSGALQGFWAMDVKPWDMAAGALIVKEAGGMVIDVYGGEQFLETGSILAASPKLMKSILPHLQLVRP